MKKFFSYFKRTIALVLLACIVAGTVQPCFAAEEKIVKIAYIDNKDFIQMDETGKMVGYAVDYLDKISKYTGWKYVYIHMTMDEVLKGLLNGRADFFVPATRTHKRDELYEFSDLAVATECGILYAPRNSKIYYEDFSALNFQKIGIVKGTVAKMTLDIYAKKKNFNYTAVEYESEDELKKALDNEEIAAATGINFSTFDGYKAIGQYSCEDSYFMSSLDSKLMPQLNDALEQIKISDHTFEAELYSKYYLSGNAFKEPLFTRDENTYIRNSKVLKIGYRENTLPLSGTNKDGIPEGINIDLLHYVEKLSGLKFNLVPVQDMREGLDLIENDSLDLLLGINSRSIDFRRETVQVTEKILDYDVVCVGRKGGALSTGSNSTIALLTGVNGFNEELRGMFKNCQFIYGKTSADCLDLVAKGKADFSFQNEYILSYLMNNPKYYNLQTSVGYTFDESQCIAISSKQNAMLMRIMDKTIGAIQNDFVYQTAIHHTNNFNNDISFFDLFAPYKYPIVIIILLGIICIALLLVMQYLKRREKHKEQLLVNERLANEAKNEFMSRMSHELRTPMNAIIGLTQLANEEPKNPMNTTNYLNKIDNSSQFLLLLLNDILDMSKMESKKIKLKIESTDFNDVLYGVEDIIVPQAKKKGVKYELTTVGYEGKAIFLDKLRLQQILINLLANAVKFTPRGGTVTLHIERTSTSSEHADIRFEIIDTGAGMCEEFIPHAFEPFEQENNGEKGGTGLGLAICKNLVETMGGTIKVESKKGVGTKFTITLSFPYSHEMPKAKHVEVAVSQANFDGLHILMAEDHPLNTEIVQKLLEKRGFIVDTAENGKIAVDKFAQSEKNYYCAILMDVRMPEMDGLTATKKIRGLERADGKTIPIIAISANAFDEDIGKAKASGMTSYLAKPINSTQMFEVLAEYIYK